MKYPTPRSRAIADYESLLRGADKTNGFVAGLQNMQMTLKKPPKKKGNRKESGHGDLHLLGPAEEVTPEWHHFFRPAFTRLRSSVHCRVLLYGELLVCVVTTVSIYRCF